VVFRSERKKLLRSHVDIAKYLFTIVEQLIGGKLFDLAAFNKTVLETLVQDGETEISKQFMPRRISVRFYLQELY